MFLTLEEFLTLAFTAFPLIHIVRYGCQTTFQFAPLTLLPLCLNCFSDPTPLVFVLNCNAQALSS